MNEDNPIPPAPPPSELLAAAAPPSVPSNPSALVDFLRRQFEMMEAALLKERERARESENTLRQQAALRDEADHQLKAILEQLKAEKKERERSEEKSHDQGRIEALEKRLDEMHASWVNLVKENFAKRDNGSEQMAVQATASAAGIRALSESLAAARQELEDIDRRITVEIRRHEESRALWAKERASLSEALEEQRHQIRQEYTKERIALQQQMQDQLEGLKKTAEKIEKDQSKDSQTLSAMQDLFGKTNEMLRRPAKAKDQLVAELELEKKDLMEALQERSEALRTYTAERRQAERQLGDNVMDLNRKLETQRAKEIQHQSQISELRLQLEAAQSKQRIVDAMTAERDNLLQALVEATQKLQQAAAGRAESEQVWESRFEQTRKDLEVEKEKRLAADSQNSDLAAKNRTLTDHLARVVQESEKIGAGQAQWKEDRERLLAEIRKKEELLSLLSATFQNLLKK